MLQVFFKFKLHPHLHFLVTEGGVDGAGVLRRVPRIDDLRLAEISARAMAFPAMRKYNSSQQMNAEEI